LGAVEKLNSPEVCDPKAAEFRRIRETSDFGRAGDQSRDRE
jgi:hypothetical protein